MDRTASAVLAEPSLGTRFLIYPQVPHLAGYDKAETVWISTSPSAIRAGPEDRRVYVRDPLFDKEPYDYPYLPPFVGETFALAEADFDGHFDQIDPGSRQFVAAHAFACVSRVLDIWESYLGGPIAWFFADTYERLEIIPWIDWHNAQCGYGYLELGRERADDGRDHPFAFNFDVIAHEVAHAILFSVVGTPQSGSIEGDFGPFHEANADLVSLLSFLHFDSGMDRLLRHCGGNLLVLNELNRIAELTGDRQIRLASNARRISEVTEEIHDRSRPFTGAVFDTLVDIYHRGLVQEGLADERLLRVDLRHVSEVDLRRISDFTERAFRSRPLLFNSELIKARDAVARVLGCTWLMLDPDDITFEGAARSVVEMSEQFDATLATSFAENFAWREIF